MITLGQSFDILAAPLDEVESLLRELSQTQLDSFYDNLELRIANATVAGMRFRLKTGSQKSVPLTVGRMQKIRALAVDDLNRRCWE